MIKTIKDLREAIKELPDDMPVSGYAGSGREECLVSSWISDIDEEAGINEKIFVISTD